MVVRPKRMNLGRGDRATVTPVRIAQSQIPAESFANPLIRNILSRQLIVTLVGGLWLPQASKRSDQAGDGTTTATVLAHAIVREGAKAVAAGMNPMDLKRGVDLAVVADLQKNSKNVTSNEEIAQVGIS